MKLCEATNPLGKYELPFLDIWNPEFIRVSRLKDRCSCAPDTLCHGLVYIGHVCRRHDLRYAWIWKQAGWWRRLRLKWKADQELHDGIIESYQRAGYWGEITADLYRDVVLQANWMFRLANTAIGTGKALVKAITFRGE